MSDPAQTVARAARHLDRLEFEAFLALCTPGFRYRVVAWSPELRQDMTWFDHDRESLEALFATLGEHLQRPDRMLRHLGQGIVDRDGDDAANVDTSVAVHLTDVHGQSRLWAVGRYLDRLERDGDRWMLADRAMRLDTRDLGIGSHQPI